MNRSQMIEAMAERSGLDKSQAADALGAFVGTVIDTARSGAKVSILGFGTFTTSIRSARMGRNPKTGAAVKVPASRSVRFGAGTAFREALNPKAPPKKARAKKAAQASKAPAKKAAPANKAQGTKAVKSTKKK